MLRLIADRFGRHSVFTYALLWYAASKTVTHFRALLKRLHGASLVNSLMHGVALLVESHLLALKRRHHAVQRFHLASCRPSVLNHSVVVGLSHSLIVSMRSHVLRGAAAVSVFAALSWPFPFSPRPVSLTIYGLLNSGVKVINHTPAGTKVHRRSESLSSTHFGIRGTVDVRGGLTTIHALSSLRSSRRIAPLRRFCSAIARGRTSSGC